MRLLISGMVYPWGSGRDYTETSPLARAAYEALELTSYARDVLVSIASPACRYTKGCSLTRTALLRFKG